MSRAELVQFPLHPEHIWKSLLLFALAVTLSPSRLLAQAGTQVSYIQQDLWSGSEIDGLIVLPVLGQDGRIVAPYPFHQFPPAEDALHFDEDGAVTRLPGLQGNSYSGIWGLINDLTPSFYQRAVSPQEAWSRVSVSGSTSLLNTSNIILETPVVSCRSRLLARGRNPSTGQYEVYVVTPTEVSQVSLGPWPTRTDFLSSGGEDLWTAENRTATPPVGILTYLAYGMSLSLGLPDATILGIAASEADVAVVGLKARALAGQGYRYWLAAAIHEGREIRVVDLPGTDATGPGGGELEAAYRMSSRRNVSATPRRNGWQILVHMGGVTYEQSLDLNALLFDVDQVAGSWTATLVEARTLIHTTTWNPGCSAGYGFPCVVMDGVPEGYQIQGFASANIRGDLLVLLQRLNWLPDPAGFCKQWGALYDHKLIKLKRATIDVGIRYADARLAQELTPPFLVQRNESLLRALPERTLSVPAGGLRQMVIKVRSSAPGSCRATFAQDPGSPLEFPGGLASYQSSGTFGASASARLTPDGQGGFETFFVYRAPVRFERPSYPGDRSLSSRLVPLSLEVTPDIGTMERARGLVSVTRPEFAIERVDAKDFVDARSLEVEEGPDLLCGGTPRTGVASDGEAQLLFRVRTSGVLAVGATLPAPNAGREGQLLTPGGTPSHSVVQCTNILESPGENTYTFLYRAPEDFIGQPGDALLGYRTVDLEVEVFDHDGVRHTETSTLRVVRPPLVLVHGLWSQAGFWDPFLDNLRTQLVGTETNGYVTDDEVFVFDYQSTNDAAFEVNAAKLIEFWRGGRSGARGARDTFSERMDVACAQGDFVGHSMGGLVIRVKEKLLEASGERFTRENHGAGDVNKAVLFASPQWGSPVANALLHCHPWGNGDELVRAFVSSLEDGIGPAVDQLRIGGDTMRTLGSLSDFPVRVVRVDGCEQFHVVDSFSFMSVALVDFARRTYSTQPSILAELVKDYAVRANLIGFALFPIQPSDVFGVGLPHDFLVLQESQEAGLPSSAVMSVQAFGANPALHSPIVRELRGARGLLDALQRPPSEYASFLPAPSPTFEPNLVFNPNCFSFPSLLDLSASGTDGPTVLPGQTVRFTITGLAGFQATEVFLSSPFGTLWSDRAPYEFDVTVPWTAIGTYRFNAYGVDASGQRSGSLPVLIRVDPQVSPLALRAAFPVENVAIPLLQQSLEVEADFPDGVTRRISSADYRIVTTTGQAIEDGPNGSYLAVEEGQSTVEIAFAGLTATASVDVQFPDVTSYSHGTLGAGQREPTLAAVGSIVPGTSLTFEVRNVVGGSTGMLWGSIRAGMLSVECFRGLVNPFGYVITHPFTLGGSAGTPGVGQHDLTFTIPNEPTLVGLRTYWQGVFVDASTCLGWSSSHGLALRIGGP